MPFQTIEKTVPGLTPGERYVVRVRAISSLGVVSDWSEAYEINIEDAPSITEWLEQELTLHVNDPDPHDQYALADGSRGSFEEEGAVSTHESAADPHDQYALADGSRGEFLPLSKVYTEYFSTASISEGGTRTLSVSFPSDKFSSAPHVSVSPFCTTTSANISFHVTQVSSSTASIVLRNNGEDSVSVGAYVLAVQP